MNKRINLKKNLFFTLIIILGISYIALVSVATEKILPGFAMQIIFILNLFKNSTDAHFLFTNADFYLNLAGGSILLYSYYLMFKAAIRFFKTIDRTLLFLLKLNVIENDQDILIVHSPDSFVFTAGFFSPKVYMSDKLQSILSNKEYEAVAEHERYHVASFDPIKKIIVSLVKDFLPAVFWRDSVFEDYFVLTELCADFHSETIVESKRPILASLLKISEQAPVGIALSGFNMSQDRIEIFVGKNKFNFGKILMVLSFSIVSFASASLMLDNSEIFMKCERLDECIDSLFSSNVDINIKERSICGITKTNSYQCFKIAERKPFSTPINRSIRLL